MYMKLTAPVVSGKNCEEEAGSEVKKGKLRLNSPVKDAKRVGLVDLNIP